MPPRCGWLLPAAEPQFYLEVPDGKAEPFRTSGAEKPRRNNNDLFQPPERPSLSAHRGGRAAKKRMINDDLFRPVGLTGF
jgi:hypothetical protein